MRAAWSAALARFISRPRCCIPLLSAPVFQAAAYRSTFSFDWPVSRVRRKKAKAVLCASTRMPCFTTANRAATYFRRRDARGSKNVPPRRVAVESNLKKKKDKGKKSDAAPRENANEWRRRSYFPEFRSGRVKAFTPSRALLCFAGTLCLSNRNLRVRVIKDSADLITREATKVR